MKKEKELIDTLVEQMKLDYDSRIYHRDASDFIELWMRTVEVEVIRKFMKKMEGIIKVQK